MNVSSCFTFGTVTGKEALDLHLSPTMRLTIEELNVISLGRASKKSTFWGHIP